VSEFGLGYRGDKENHVNLALTASPFVMPETYNAPTSVSQRAWRKAKNQGQVGRCSGASRSSGEEVLNYIATGGQVVKFSMDYAYAENQKECGLWGSDQGATIDGSCKASIKTGIVLEEIMPQKPGYNPNIPAGAEDIGKRHLIKSHVLLPTVDKARQWILTGNGVILIGINWTTGLAGSKARITRSTIGGGILGGHALIIHGVFEDGDLDLENSHSAAWGDNGFTRVAPEVYDYWGQKGEALIGISDLESYGFRLIKSWTEQFA
jgi:hypothetical protein